MTLGQFFDQQQVGQRLADARIEAGLTQSQLGEAIGLDRTAVAKIEAGTRKVSAVELAHAATELGRPLDWFLLEAPPSVVSRRGAAAAGYAPRLDQAVEKAAADVEFLIEQGIVTPTMTVPELWLPRDTVDGRRRFTLAHEIGHHLFGDEYSTDISLHDVGSEAERRINQFAVDLLLPVGPVKRQWEASTEETRERTIRLGVDYRVSWSALCSRLKNLGLIDDGERQALLDHPPTRADYLELGAGFVAELTPPFAPPGYARAVLRGYRSGKLGPNRTVDLLWDSITNQDLPELDALPIEAYQREFDPLP